MEIQAKLAEQLPDLEEEKQYQIKRVERIKTALRGLDGIRVTLEDGTGKEYATMLWLRDIVSNISKLGVFLQALGKDTDQWVGKFIYVHSWKPRQRDIEVIGGEAEEEEKPTRRKRR